MKASILACRGVLSCRLWSNTGWPPQFDVPGLSPVMKRSLFSSLTAAVWPMLLKGISMGLLLE